jgi:hypothetical protein
VAGGKEAGVRTRRLASRPLIGLHKLYLDDTPVTNKDLKGLATLRKLHLLWLDGTQVTDEGLRELVPLKGLARQAMRSR